MRFKDELDKMQHPAAKEFASTSARRAGIPGVEDQVNRDHYEIEDIEPENHVSGPE